MRDAFRWALAQNFGYRLACECAGFSKLNLSQENREIVIIGKLPLGSEEFDTKSTAECTFVVNDQWIESPPIAICKEPWVTLGKEDWHISKDGVLCWDYDVYWKDMMTSEIKQGTHGEGAYFGTRWMLRSVRNLLNRHLFASRTGIKVWRKEWDYWGHGPEAAAVEYSRLRTSERLPLAVVPEHAVTR